MKRRRTPRAKKWHVAKTGRKMVIKLFGGPVSGMVMEVPTGTERVRVRFWEYEFAGRDGKQVQFAIRSRSRQQRKFVLWYVGKFSKHPVVEQVYAQQRPTVGRGTKRGRGAAKRAARKVAS